MIYSQALHMSGTSSGKLQTDLFEIPFLLSNKYDLIIAICDNCN